ncbi:MAG: M14-type cytosolic carboxypeptidase [Polyangiaceae bacterium]
MKLDADFDGGSIVVLGETRAGEIALALRTDSASDHRQWFCFRSFGDIGERRAFRIENASECELPNAWDGYHVCASYDGETWFRVPTRYDDGALRFRLTPSRRAVTFAYFAPYSHARLRRLIRRTERSDRARVTVLGETVQGRPIPSITFGRDSAAAARIWIIARQHPGETMASWCAEGIVDRLLDPDDPITSALLEDAQLTVVPWVNIDGGVLGNHRTNAAGFDLNRAWQSPDLESTPEVFAVRSAILSAGVDLFLDLHGDESIPLIFAACCEGNPGYTPRLHALETSFLETLALAAPGFSADEGYVPDDPGEADLTLAANWIGERFDCLSLTLEMPFKDAEAAPDPRRGWTPQRSISFGRSLLEVALLSVPTLR